MSRPPLRSPRHRLQPKVRRPTPGEPRSHCPRRRHCGRGWADVLHPYALTGRLWVPIGLHLAWNFAQGYIFGAAGLRQRPRRLDRRQHRPPWCGGVADRRQLRPGSLSISPTTFDQLGDGRSAGAGPGRPAASLSDPPSVPVGREPALLTALLIGAGCSPPAGPAASAY